MRSKTVRLRKPLRRALQAGHPWVFRDALEPFEVEPGTVVTVVDERRRFVARGLAEHGPIAVRVWTCAEETLGAELLARRVQQADALRRRVIHADTTAFRLLHGEGDRTPGIVCDLYGEWASVQFDGQGVLAWRDDLLHALKGVLAARGVRGALLRTGRRGARTVELAWGDEPPDEVTVQERGLRLVGSLRRGQKTGLFLDHREARARVGQLAGGLRVLDLYAYVGGFSAAAGRGGAARVDTVDVAPEAIALAARTWAANGLADSGRAGVAADVPEFLAKAQAAGRRWDLIIADPPSFAPNEASKAKALDSYARLHGAALSVLAPGGLLLAASCSSHVRAAEFDQALTEGAKKAKRVLQVLERGSAPADHPRLLAFPEGDYLKVVLARAD